MQSNHFKQTEDFFQALEYGREFLASKPSSFPDGLDIEGIDKNIDINSLDDETIDREIPINMNDTEKRVVLNDEISYKLSDRRSQLRVLLRS